MSPSMTNALISIIIILLISIGSIKSETLNCRGRCGPCQFPDELCTLKCLQYESCKDSRLTCSPSGQNMEFCTVDCSDEKACIGTQVSAQTVSQLTINCYIMGSCEQTVVYAAPQSTVFINCDADNSCSGLVVHGYSAKHVYIACIGMNSCEGINVQCGTGDCILACLNNLGGVCGQAYLGCGNSPKCQINCSGNNKCENLRVDASTAIGFECIGTPTECQTAPFPFMLPTKAPTHSPTTAPTLAPTQPPTKAPTPNPTYAPTAAPSFSPTPGPTDSPTYIPTPAPTSLPTKAPSPAPTFNPTPSPTNNPTKSPTRDPTIDPTVSPTPETLSPTTNPTYRPTPNPTTDPTGKPTLYPTLSPTEPTLDPTIDPTIPTKEPTMNPTIDPTASPTHHSLHPANLARQNNSALAALSTNETVASLLLVCIIFAGLCCCCLPFCLCIYCKFGRRYFDKKWRKRSQSVLDNEEVIDEQGVPFGDIEGDYSHYDFNGRHKGHLRKMRGRSRGSRASRGSVVGDGYSDNYGSSNSRLFGTNSLRFATNGRRHRSNKKQLESLMEEDPDLQEADDYDKTSGMYQDSEATKDIIRVTIWFIEKVKLPQYCELFILNGYTSLKMIKKIKNMRQLEMLGIERGDHQFDIMSAINILAGRGMYLEDSESDYTSSECGDGRSRRTGATNGRRRGGKRDKRRNKDRYDRHYDDVELELCERDEIGDGQRETRGVSNDEFIIRGDDDDQETLGPYAADANQVWQIADVMDEDLTMTQKRSKKNKRGRGRDRDRDRDRIQPPKAVRNGRGDERSRSKGRKAKAAGKVFVRDISEERRRKMREDGRGDSRSRSQGRRAVVNNNGKNRNNKGKKNKVDKGKEEQQRVSALDIISRSTKLENKFSEGNDGKVPGPAPPAAAFSIHDSESSELMMEMMNLGVPNHSHSASSDSSVFDNFRQ